MTGKIYLGKGEEIKCIGVKNDLVSKFKKFIFKTNAQWYISVGIAIIGYIFYQFGYGFLYGFYFGVDNSTPSVMDVMINQVPFDFKLIAIIGSIVLIIMCVYFLPMLNYMLSDDFCSKIIYLIMHIFIFCFMLAMYCSATSTGQNTELNVEMLNILLILSAGSALMFFIIKSCFFSTSLLVIGKKIFILIFYIIVLIVFNIKIIVKPYIYSITAFQIILLVGALDYFFCNDFSERKYCKYILMAITWIPVIATILFIVLAINNQVRFVSLRVAILIAIIIAIVVVILAYMYKTIIKKKRNKVIGQGVKKNTEVKRGKGIVLTLIIFVLFSFVISFFLVYDIFCSFGDLMGQESTLSTESKVTYYSTDGIQREQKGIVVAQKDNTYYISDENRKLVVISSPYVTIE